MLTKSPAIVANVVPRDGVTENVLFVEADDGPTTD